MLFGNDILDIVNECEYKNKDGTYETVSLFMMIKRITLDPLGGYLSPIGTILPFILDKELIKPKSKSSNSK